MTGLLGLRLKAIRNSQRNSYRQRNSIHEQIMKESNKKRQDKSLKNDNVLLQIKRIS